MDPIFDDNYVLEIPNGFPAPIIPEDNALTQTRIALGKKLFFDKQLSLDNTISCASCHFQANAFSDPDIVSTGIQGRTGFRNAPPLQNLAWQTSFMRDGGVPTIELQVLAPINDHNEMDFTIPGIVSRLADNETYQKLSKRAYGRSLDAFVLTRALAAFERTLVSGNSKYDRAVQGLTTLTANEINGMNLFNSSTINCSSCHGGFNFTNGQFENNGLYAVYADSGRARITFLSSDNGKFRVPSLRNIAVTSPYMHDGSKAGLEDVVDHYASGGFNHANKSNLITGFSISAQEKSDLIAFLNCLTDSTFLTNTAFREP